MGQKHGKHRREGDEEGETSLTRSPKRSSKRGSKSSRTPSRESTPPNIETLDREPRAGPKTKDIVIESKTTADTVPKSASPPKKSPTKKSPSKGGKKKAKIANEEVIVKSEDKGVESGHGNPQTPVKDNRPELEPVTPTAVNDMSITNHHPQATSTPAAPNGIVSTGVTINSPHLSPESTDHSASEDEDEENTPTDQQHDSSMERKSGMNFGRFYTGSYLENSKTDYLKRASLNPKETQKSPHYHRPPNFSYSSDKPEFLKARKISASGSSGMMALASGQTRVVKVRRSSSPSSLRNSEAVRMSTYPGGKRPAPNEVEKIERDDWPGPASPAAILPEILRERRRSRGEKDEDEEEEVQQDPKFERELEEISKLKDKSGIGSLIYKELEERKSLPKKPMDPWLSSRVPSAKYVPRYSTRFQSPMFASPSRFLDRPRYAWDDSDIRGYRSLSGIGYGYSQTPKPGYGPSYGVAPRAATLPLSGLFGARDEFDIYHINTNVSAQNGDRTTPSSTLNADGVPKREPRVWGISGVSGYEGPSISLLKLQKSTWHTEAEPPIYPYEKLKITNFDLPKDVDTNHLEIHLNDEEFQSIFEMPKDKFYRLAEWKRNDIKRKQHLY
ncbi:dematin-like isoform X5 [Haliotis asinina]|uniref:dematin-like isoform X5 n=1 Tax=Haliotis asinina TaxID=109174 RepID=UPI0035319D2A